MSENKLFNAASSRAAAAAAEAVVHPTPATTKRE